MNLVEVARKLIDDEFSKGESFITDEGIAFEFISDELMQISGEGLETTLWEYTGITLPLAPQSLG